MKYDEPFKVGRVYLYEQLIYQVTEFSGRVARYRVVRRWDNWPQSIVSVHVNSVMHENSVELTDVEAATALLGGEPWASAKHS